MAAEVWGDEEADDGDYDGDMELPEEEEDDGDYSPSDVDSDDSLEWANETERTKLEDALAEGNVGINYADAAVSMTTEYLASFKLVQMGLGAAAVLPLPPLQRAARAAQAQVHENFFRPSVQFWTPGLQCLGHFPHWSRDYWRREWDWRKDTCTGRWLLVFPTTFSDLQYFFRPYTYLMFSLESDLSPLPGERQ